MKSEKEYEELVKKLEKKGYRKYPPHNNASETWFKGFLRDENVWEEDRSCYQICWSIWDFHKFFAEREPRLVETPYGMDICVMVSRTVDERVDLQLNSCFSVEEAEDIATSFYAWVKDNIKVQGYDTENKEN